MAFGPAKSVRGCCLCLIHLCFRAADAHNCTTPAALTLAAPSARSPATPPPSPPPLSGRAPSPITARPRRPPAPTVSSGARPARERGACRKGRTRIGDVMSPSHSCKWNEYTEVGHKDGRPRAYGGACGKGVDKHW